jgi:transposase InsO family protein
VLRSIYESDNGPEFIAKEVQRWLSENQIRTIYIDPGSPWQNGFERELSRPLPRRVPES